MHAVAGVYRGFERRLVGLLRQYDRYRHPEMIHPLDVLDHRERTHAFRHYRLEECLYPSYPWVVPLYYPDMNWERLLPALRAVEGMMLHQGSVEGRDITRGLNLIQETRILGHRAATEIDEI